MLRRHPLTTLGAVVLTLAATFVASRWDDLGGALSGIMLYLAASALMVRASRPTRPQCRRPAEHGPYLRVVDPPPYDWARRGRW